jgi:hypothetical protein
MSLRARLGKTILKRIESAPAIQERMARSERTMPVIRAAHRAAYGSLDDEAAKINLREQLNGGAEILEEALADLHSRDGYINDRVYRLLASVATDTDVAVIPVERAALFAEEGEIGRMPMKQAFRRLAELEPRLLDLEHQTPSASQENQPGSCELPKHVREQLHQLVGGGTSNDHELLHTALASSIVHQYLQILAGNTRLGAPDVAYFDSPIKHFVSSHLLFDFKRKDTPKRM